MMKAIISYPALLAMLVTLALVTLGLGAASLPLTDIFSTNPDPIAGTILWQIRLPRLLLVVLVGGAVAMTGAAIQGLFRNPLADPALIGVSSGAALFAVAYLVLGGSAWLGQTGLILSAFAGGLLATLVVVAIGQRSQGIAGMLLAGIAINALCLAGVGLFTFLSDDGQLRSVAFWALGSFAAADWSATLGSFLLLPAMYLLFRERRHLDLITLGDDAASHLGLDIRRFRLRVIFYTAFIISVSVALVGIISFVGLIVPHIIRLVRGSTHSSLLPFSALLGSVVLLFADNVGRIVVSPAELPVGLLTSLVGGPFFVYLILKQRDRLAI
jgi:iron complex transport system permease protein